MILGNFNLKKYNSMHLSVWADYFCEPRTLHELYEFLEFIRNSKTNWTVIGGGSNIIFRKSRFTGAILVVDTPFYPVKVRRGENEFCAFESLAKIVKETTQNGFGDLTFLYGIPGTLAGAVSGNAGTRYEWISQVVKAVELLNENKEIRVVQKYDSAYRFSELPHKGEIITKVSIDLHTVSPELIKQKLEQIRGNRKNQPSDYPVAGSVFQNPNGNSAWKLIDVAGLRGFCISAACVSKKHPNFIVNKGDALPEDVIALISTIKERVFQNSGILLKEEVKII